MTATQQDALLDNYTLAIAYLDATQKEQQAEDRLNKARHAIDTATDTRPAEDRRLLQEYRDATQKYEVARRDREQARQALDSHANSIRPLMRR